MEKDHDLETTVGAEGDQMDAPINPSGHRQELDRNFHLINICGLGLTSGNTWIAIGGSIVGFPFLHSVSFVRGWPCSHAVLQVVAIYNGGPPGVIYELCVQPYYCAKKVHYCRRTR
jgi:choline transport protein